MTTPPPGDPRCTECGSPLPARPEGKPGPKSRTCGPACSAAGARRKALEKYEAALKAGTPVLRKCKRCGDTIAARVGSWVMSGGQPTGRVCLRCHIVRQKTEVNPKIRAKRAKSSVQQLRRVELRARALQRQQSLLGADADAGLRLGARVLNDRAEQVAERLRAAVEDPESPFHQQALELVASRILPQATVTKFALQMARRGEFGESASRRRKASAPRIVVTISQTEGPSE